MNVTIETREKLTCTSLGGNRYTITRLEEPQELYPADTAKNGTNTFIAVPYTYGGVERLLDVHIYFPQNYSTVETVPCIVSLPGQGEMSAPKERVFGAGIAKRINEGTHYNCIHITPSHTWEFGGFSDRWIPETLVQILDFIIANYRINTNKLSITGFSIGGNGVWRMLVDPVLKSYFSGALIAAAFTKRIFNGADRDLTLEACAVPDIPIKEYHSSDDSVSPYQDVLDMNTAIAACGVRVNTPELTTLSGGHTGWEQMYDNEIDWLLTQAK